MLTGFIIAEAIPESSNLQAIWWTFSFSNSLNYPPKKSNEMLLHNDALFF
jgi:hypothetical protein